MNNVYLFRTDDSLKDAMLKDFLSLSKEHERSSTASNNINHNIGLVVCFQNLNLYALGKVIIFIYNLIIFLIFTEYHTCKHVIEDIR